MCAMSIRNSVNESIRHKLVRRRGAYLAPELSSLFAKIAGVDRKPTQMEPDVEVSAEKLRA
jgi:hypothetical protein